MADFDTIKLRETIQIRNALTTYRDNTYVNMLTKINTQYQNILKDDLGSNFVKSCSRDLAGEVVRNYFDTSNFYVTVDQLAMRILDFDYKHEYDPLRDNEQIHKSVYNYDEKTSSVIEGIISEMDSNQKKLFEKTDGKYVDHKMIKEEKDIYVKAHKNEDGTINDGYTGDEGEYLTDKNGVRRRRLQVDHVQALATAKYDARYITEKGQDKIKKIYNSENNFEIMLDTANQAKGDVKVFDKNGQDITHRATPEQYTDAIVKRWEGVHSPETKQRLIDKGYLNPDGTVPKHIKDKLLQSMETSQNAEGHVILTNVKFGVVGKDALSHTKKALGKIIAGQIIYYVAPPLVFELREIVSKKPSSIETAIEALTAAGERMGEYIFSKLKPMFNNIAVSSLKNFIKIFMDILFNLVKGVVKRFLKIGKNLLLATVDAIKVLSQKETTRAQKADAVCNLFGVTITTVVIDTLFETIQKGAYLPDFLLMPLQILATVVCTNFTMLVLQKVDLFDVRFGFKIQSIRKLCKESIDKLNEDLAIPMSYASAEIAIMLEQAKSECLQIYKNINEQSPYEKDFRNDLNKINHMFDMKIDFDQEWLNFIGVKPLVGSN